VEERRPRHGRFDRKVGYAVSDKSHKKALKKIVAEIEAEMNRTDENWTDPIDDPDVKDYAIDIARRLQFMVDEQDGDEIVLCYSVPAYVHVNLEKGSVTRYVVSVDGAGGEPDNVLDFRWGNQAGEELTLDSKPARRALKIAEENDWPGFEIG